MDCKRVNGKSGFNFSETSKGNAINQFEHAKKCANVDISNTGKDDRGRITLSLDQSQDRDPLFSLVQRADTVNDLQIVVLREVEHEAIGHRLDFAEAAIDEDGFLAVVVAGADVGGIFHPAFGAEGGHDAAQTFCPVAGAKLAPLGRQTDDDEGGRFRRCHCFHSAWALCDLVFAAF